MGTACALFKDMTQAQLKTGLFILAFLLGSVFWLRHQYGQFPSSAKIEGKVNLETGADVELFAAQNKSEPQSKVIIADSNKNRTAPNVRFRSFPKNQQPNRINAKEISDDDPNLEDAQPIKAVAKKEETGIDLEFDEEGNIIIKEEDKKKDEEDEKVAEAEHDNEEEEKDEEGEKVAEKDENDVEDNKEGLAKNLDQSNDPTNSPFFFDPSNLLPELAAAAAGPGLAAEGDDLSEQLIDGKELSEFIKDFLDQPTEQSTLMLVGRFQAGEITSPQFYQIVQEMLQDSRNEVKRLGLFALGSTPSTESFLRLVSIGQEQGVSADLSAQAQTYLGQYAALDYLPALEPILASNSQEVSISAYLTALSLVDEVVLQFNPRNPAADGSDEETRTLQLRRIAQILENAISNNPDATTLASTQQTLLNLQARL